MGVDATKAKRTHRRPARLRWLQLPSDQAPTEPASRVLLAICFGRARRGPAARFGRWRVGVGRGCRRRPDLAATVLLLQDAMLAELVDQPMDALEEDVAAKAHRAADHLGLLPLEVAAGEHLVLQRAEDLGDALELGARVQLVQLRRLGVTADVQLAEIAIGGDIVVLATPEIAGLPYVISGLVAAGGLAAALSTADGLLLTIANALSHDVYYKMINPNASTATRVGVSKALLLVVALAAAYVASLKTADILFLVSAAFSLAAAGFFPALVLGIFWKRATSLAAVLGMIAGVSVTFYYMATTQVWMRGLFGVTSPIADNIWWDIQPISAGVFGVPLGFLVIILVSLVTPAPKPEVQELVEHVRYPNLRPGAA